MASSPQGIYTRLKTRMKNAYYTDNTVNNLENFRTEASAFLSGPGEYEDLPFLKICENLEGHGDIGWDKLENLKTLVQSTTGGKEQLLHMINEAEREIHESLSGLGSRLPPERDALKPRMKGEEMVVYMEKDVIKEAKKTDEAYYQCIAKAIEIEVKGKAVPLEVDSDEERGSNIHGTHRSHSSASSGTGVSHNNRNSKSSSRSQDKHSCSPEDRHQGKRNSKELAIQILMSSCQMMFTIYNYNDVARLSSFIEDAFYAATDEKQRIDKLTFEKKCIQVFITIKAANSLSEAPAVCLAEQFKHYILDVGLQVSEESNDILEVDEASIKITPEHMPEDGLPLVNISHQQGAVQHSESVILQTYIIASPPALSIEWFKIKADDHEISIKIDCKKYYGCSDLSPSLIIRNVNVDDQGWYICRATNNNGTGCSNKTFVRISSESTRAEDKPGKLETDISNIPDYTMTARSVNMPRTYVDNESNQSLGRVGMPVGSTPVSSGSSASGGGASFGGSSSGRSSYGGSSTNTYVDNVYNRSVGRVGMEHGTAVMSKSSSSSISQSSYPRTYVDNAQNRREGWVGMEHRTALISRPYSSSTSKSYSSKTCVDDAQNRREGWVGMEHGTAVISRPSSSSTSQSSSPRTYVDNAQNRREVRVGKEHGTAVISKSSSQSSGARVYVDNPFNRRLGRVGLPLGSMSVSRSSGRSGSKTGPPVNRKESSMTRCVRDLTERYYERPEEDMDLGHLQEDYRYVEEVSEQAADLINRMEQVRLCQQESQKSKEPLTSFDLLKGYRGERIEFD
ncbi:uncharacterized protein LOC110449008 [Mizuhopecten yessoensis]|uniref:uncharacterized protein LOC110449008 n=1 Tax=Mizuhopecten yessoensis TaxID=6573 RepID=UPI000B45C065|nr:uncharacterized protein LOC110449008 [Mizuhopecten yessoensis]